jgi:hypothetical protein
MPGVRPASNSTEFSTSLYATKELCFVKLLQKLTFLSIVLASVSLIGCGSGPAAGPSEEEQRRIEEQMQQEMEAMPTLPQQID